MTQFLLEYFLVLCTKSKGFDFSEAQARDGGSSGA